LARRGLLLTFVLVLLAACAPQGQEEALREAQDLLASGQPAEARVAFQEFIQTYPDSKNLPWALFGLASADHLRLDRYASALAIYHRLILLFPTHETAPLTLERLAGIYLSNLKDYPAAIRILTRLRDEYGRNDNRWDEYQDRISWACFMMDDYPAARQACSRLIEESPDSPLAEQAYLRLADSYYVQDMIPQALTAYQEALARFPGGRFKDRIKFRTANCLEETGQLTEARRVYLEILESYDNPEAVRIRLAGVEKRLKEGVR